MKAPTLIWNWSRLLVLAHVSSLTPDPPPSPPRADEAMEVEAVATRFANGDEDKAGRIRRTTLSIADLRQRNIEKPPGSVMST
jgi:hypothetical protein